MYNRYLLAVIVLGVGMMLGGCVGTGGGNQFDRTIYDTYSRVSNLDKNLDASVTRLNETTSALTERVDESDQHLRNVERMLDQNQAKLTNLETKLESLTNIIHQQQGRTLLPGTPAPVQPQPQTQIGVGDDGYEVAPPGAASQTAVQHPQRDTDATAWRPPEPLDLEPVEVEPQEIAAVAQPESAGSADADYLEAQKSYIREDYEGALARFGAFLHRYPLSDQAQRAHFWRAKSFQSLERYEEAIAEYNRLREAYPIPPGDIMGDSLVPSAMHQQAVCHARLGQIERAIDLFRQVIRDFPNSPAAAQATSDLQRVQ